MWQVFAEQNVLLYTMAAVCLVGVISQVVLYGIYQRLIRDMERGGASKRKFMKQVRQRYENGRRTGEAISNIEVFVRKQLMEYRFLGVGLHRWQSFGTTAYLVCMVLGILGYYGASVKMSAELMGESYLLAMLTATFLTAGIYGLTDVRYKGQYVETGLCNMLCNTGLGQNYPEVTLLEPEEVAEEVYTVPKVEPLEPRKNRRRAETQTRKNTETQAQKDKRELKENLAKLKESMNETAAAREKSKERNTAILRQMEPEEQERIIREVLNEFLS